MTVFTGVIVYLLVFWTVLFAVLPWGVSAIRDKAPELAGGAPENPRIKVKFLMTAIISAFLWIALYSLIKMDVIDFYEIATQMEEEDSL